MPYINLFSSGSGGGNEPTGTDISSATVTLDSNSFTYDGTLKTKTVTSVVLNNTTLVYGTDYYVTGNEATNVGTYTLSVVGIGDYYGSATASWSIAKITPPIELDKNSVGMQPSKTEIITVTTNSDGAISAQSSATSICTVSVSGNVVTVTSIAEGSANVTISTAATTNCNAASIVCPVLVHNIPAVLADATPAQIQLVAQYGIASSIWSVGDKTEAISISAYTNFTATSACAFIIGFDHNSSVEGTGIHFQFGKTTTGTNIALCDSGYASSKTSGIWFNMNNSSSKTGGWRSSAMRNTICAVFLAKLPQEWQDVISTTTKYSDNAGNSANSASSVTSTSDKIWLLAEYEVQGSRTYANSAEQNYQKQYDYYKNGNSKIKYKNTNTSTACYWWLRSVYATGSGIFCRVSTSGGAATQSVTCS